MRGVRMIAVFSDLLVGAASVGFTAMHQQKDLPVEDDLARFTSDKVQFIDRLLTVIEEDIVPLYYAQDRHGVPHGWTRMIREAIRTVTPVFCARRMMKDYTRDMYLPIVQSLKKRP